MGPDPTFKYRSSNFLKRILIRFFLFKKENPDPALNLIADTKSSWTEIVFIEFGLKSHLFP